MVASLIASDASAQALVLVDSVDYLSNIEATDRSTYPSSHPSTELSPGIAVPAVYVRGTEPDAKIYFQEFFGQSFSATLHITAARYKTLNNQTHTVTVSPSSQTVSLTGYPNLDDADISISGIPDEVSGGTLEVIAYMTLNHPVTIFWTTFPAGYVCWGNTTTYTPIGTCLYTEGTPLGVQAKPWTDLLTFVCGRAEGESTAVAVLEKCTAELYWDTRFFYMVTTPQYSSAEANFLYTFDLSSWLEHLNSTSNYFPMNCRDVSSVLGLMSFALGVDGDLTVVNAALGSGFATNPVCPMGSNALLWTNAPATFQQYGLEYHQVFVSADGVYDASLAHWKDLAGSSYRNPPMGFGLSGYWQTVSSWSSPNTAPFNQQHYPGSHQDTWDRLGLVYGYQPDCQGNVSPDSGVYQISGYH